MKHLWVEEILEAFFPIAALIGGYSCPDFDSVGKSPGKKGGNPDQIRTWVYDVGLVYGRLDPVKRMILFCLYGNSDSLGRTSKRVKKHKQLVKRLKDQALEELHGKFKEKKINLPDNILFKYVL